MDSIYYGGGAIHNGKYGITTITDTSFKNNKAIGEMASGGAIYTTSDGAVSIISKDKDVVFEGNMAGSDSSNLKSNAIHNEGGILNLNAAEGRNIVFNDSITGNNRGIYKAEININKEGNRDNKEETITGSHKNAIPTDAPTTGTVVLNNNMENYAGKVNMYGGTIQLGQNGTLFSNAASFNVYNNSTLNTINNKIQTHNFGNLHLYGNLNLAIDADLVQEKLDSFTANTFTTEPDAKITIGQVNVIADAAAEKAGIDMSDYSGEVLDIITLEDSAKSALGKIYKYDVSFDEDKKELSFERAGLIETSSGNGSSNLTVNQVNPAVMTGPVAIQAGYYTQLNSYDQAFQNTVSRMMTPKLQRQLSSAKNRYAIVENNQRSGFYFENEGQNVYMRPYTSFEKADLRGGIDVDNIMYGTFIGTDGSIIELKNGKKFQLSGYLAYNGSHQSFDLNSIQQNGANIGIAGSLYKNNFFGTITANVGANMVYASNMFGKEDFPMLMTGVAGKTGYNFEFKDGKFIIQPNVLVSYSFINAYDYTNAAGVKISSDPLHGIQVAPGVRFVMNTESGFQPYLSVAMKWNFMEGADFKAASVALPALSSKAYVEYGAGVQKCFRDKVNSYLQALVRNGGRTGVALTAGMDFLIGKNRKAKENL